MSDKSNDDITRLIQTVNDDRDNFSASPPKARIVPKPPQAASPAQGEQSGEKK